jgi:signal transduction histidine kinase
VSFRASVGRRLFLLVTIQTAIALLLVVVAVRTMSRLASDYRHMYEFQFASVAAIGHAMGEATSLKSGGRSPILDDFYRRYREDWETAAGSTSDAIAFRQDLTQAGASDLPRIELKTLADLERSLNSGDAQSVKQSLAALHAINVKYAELENFYVMQRMQFGRTWIIVIGIAGSVLILFLGLRVRRAIAPRIKELVTHVRNFQESGKAERVGDPGNDDITVLANALDAGFTAIASREREREQFLSIAAHELKTPVTSIHGYASLLVNHPPRAVDIERALKSINRQSWRLSRLIDALFLAMKARTGKLNFEPKPFDMSALVDRVLVEMEPLMTRRSFAPQIDECVSILGDEALLEHALWALFTCASTFAVEDSAMHVAFFAIDQRARLTFAISGADVSIPEIEELFRPFRFIEYETGSGIRAAVGLYLCREIVRLHNGSLRVEELSKLRPQFVMDVAR